MNHIKCTISCGTYPMVHIIWTILYGTYKTVQIVRSIRNCQLCLDAQEQTLLHLRTQLQLKNTSVLFRRKNCPYKNYFVKHRLTSRNNNYWPAMVRIFTKINPIFLYVKKNGKVLIYFMMKLTFCEPKYSSNSFSSSIQFHQVIRNFTKFAILLIHFIFVALSSLYQIWSRNTSNRKF